jgi:hypothetical protein
LSESLLHTCQWLDQQEDQQHRMRISQVQENTEMRENAPQDKATLSAKSPLPEKKKLS